MVQTRARNVSGSAAKDDILATLLTEGKEKGYIRNIEMDFRTRTGKIVHSVGSFEIIQLGKKIYCSPHSQILPA